jgi:dodecin
MAVHKVIEVLAQSDKGWEHAVQEAVTEAGKTVRNIESVYMKEMTAKVEENLIVQYRVNVMITFMVD